MIYQQFFLCVPFNMEAKFQSDQARNQNSFVKYFLIEKTRIICFVFE